MTSRMAYIVPLSILSLSGLAYYLYTKQESLEALDQKGEPSLTLYYWNQCGHCRSMMPEWNSLGSKCDGVHIRRVEANSNMELQVDSFPTIVYRYRGHAEKYEGGRNAESIKQYLLSKH